MVRIAFGLVARTHGGLEIFVPPRSPRFHPRLRERPGGSSPGHGVLLAAHNADPVSSGFGTGNVGIAGFVLGGCFQKVDGTVTELGAAQNFKVVTDGQGAMSAAELAAREEFHRKVARLFRAVSGAARTAHEVDDRLKSIREALRDTPAAEKELDAAEEAIQQKNRLILRALQGDAEMQKLNEPVASSIDNRVKAIMEGERFSLARPTQSHIDDYNIAAGEFAEALTKLHSLVEADLVKLEKDMEAAGAPWTPGRVPEWSER